jgi:hypothetical protein
MTEEHWLINFPCLQKFTLCIDPDGINSYWRGGAVPYPSLDVPFPDFDPCEWTPSEIKGVWNMCSEDISQSSKLARWDPRKKHHSLRFVVNFCQQGYCLLQYCMRMWLALGPAHFAFVLPFSVQSKYPTKMVSAAFESF